MVKVGFWFDAPFEYSGGLNYIKNLLYALAQVNDGSVQPYVFFGNSVPESIQNEFSPYATVVLTQLLERRTFPWLVHKVLDRAFGVMPLFKALLKSHGIEVLSHVWFVCKGRMPFRIVAWIPDFQYLYLPELFPGIDAAKETRTQQMIIAQCDLVILSSNNAYQDFIRIAPQTQQSRGRVLRFVSQPTVASATIKPSLSAIEEKYCFKGRYFFLPNQFWAHKNHLLVLQAIDLLKRAGIDVQVLCTGSTKDYRVSGTAYVDELRSFIASNGLDNHVHLLGLIDYCDVLFLMRNSCGVINPSRFEGWSSSVEEAKSMGKPVLLSRIGTHIEQAPPNSYYFDPDDAEELSEALACVWAESIGGVSEEMERAAHNVLRERTLDFGAGYLRLLQDVLAGHALRKDLIVRRNRRPQAERFRRHLMPLLKSIHIVLKTDGFAGLMGHVYRRVRPYRSGFLAAGRTCFEGKIGLEVGGPSQMFMRRGALPVYPLASRIDNCNFGQLTTWEGAIAVGTTFDFDTSRAPGNQYLAEATDLGGITSSNYDFVLSSHMLEHSANPLKALTELDRVLKSQGILVLALPHRDGTFDHRRPVTPLAHLIEDFERRMGEDDLTHLEEILHMHDLSKDPEAGDLQSFTERSCKNFDNRCMHHHVFDTRLAIDVIDHIGLQIISVDVFRPHDILLIARKSITAQRPDNARFMSPESAVYWRSPFPSDRQYNAGISL